MEDNKVPLKEAGYNLLVNILYLVIVILSYYLTYIILNDTNEEEKYISFLRGSFVFLSPCALEGLAFLTTIAKNKGLVDGVETTIAVGSIIVTIILMVIVLGNIEMQKELVYAILVLLGMYPLKYVILFWDTIMLVIKVRRS